MKIQYCQRVPSEASKTGGKALSMSVGKWKGNRKDNLRKTEMCRNMEMFGRCRFEERCQYAHSKLEIGSTTFNEKKSKGKIQLTHSSIDEYLARPCWDFVTTGSW
jgi:hypothetical protein